MFFERKRSRHEINDLTPDKIGLLFVFFLVGFRNSFDYQNRIVLIDLMALLMKVDDENGYERVLSPKG